MDMVPSQMSQDYRVIVARRGDKKTYPLFQLISPSYTSLSSSSLAASPLSIFLLKSSGH
jgi:hypothetical protein